MTDNAAHDGTTTAALPPDAPAALVVDDHDISRQLMSAFLASFGFASRQAETMEEAILLAATNTFVVSLVDLHLGDQNGLRLARFLARLPGTRGKPILIVSGDLPPQPLPRHIDGWLPKPYSPRALHDMLRTTMTARARKRPADAGQQT